jgi:hypothetical protein
MKKLLSVASMLAALALAPTSSVQAREFADIYTECGLGAMFAPNNGAVAAITNVTWDLGTTAVSSNVSSADTCQGGKKKVASLIQNAYPQLTADIAKGQGQNLDALSVAAQCGPTAGDKFKTQVRYQFGQSAAQGQGKTQLDKNEDLYGIVKSSAVQAGCSI